MATKPEIVFTFPASMGGVASFNFNIINFSSSIKKFHSKVILINALENKLPVFLETFNADEVITFDFSFKENRYYVLKRLNELLGKGQGCVVTDNALTVFASRQFKNPKTVYHLVHDYYYVTEAGACGDMIDVVMAHSSFFRDIVFASNPPLFNNRAFYIPYGVQQLEKFPVKENKLLKLVFLGRLDSSKGIELLYEIDKGLKHKRVHAHWSIIGKGPMKKTIRKQWANENNVTFYEPDTTAEVYDLLAQMDVFVFPTSFEGTPVSIMECISNGVVPITNDLPGGIRDIVTEKIGYRCSMNEISEYIKIISSLHHDRQLLVAMQQSCYQLAKKNYDIRNNAELYFEKFLQFNLLKREKKLSLPTVSRMDKRYYPNVFVKMLRNFKT
ncbi:MAG: glycosyltransferase [Ferruginibacter sp.]